MIEIFKMNSKDYNSDFLNNWADSNNYKIDSVNVCPEQWYLNDLSTRVIDMIVIVTIVYHKKRERKKLNG